MIYKRRPVAAEEPIPLEKMSDLNSITGNPMYRGVFSQDNPIYEETRKSMGVV